MLEIEKKVWDLINPGVEEMQLRLVRVRLSGMGGNPTLQIMVEPEEASVENLVSVSVDECAEVSRMASALLDVEDLIENKYHLEVSSTGLERPIVTLEDFKRFKGARAALKMNVPVEGQFKFKGVLGGVEEDKILLTQDSNAEQFALDYEFLQSAKRVFTDAELDKIYKEAEKEA